MLMTGLSFKLMSGAPSPGPTDLNGKANNNSSQAGFSLDRNESLANVIVPNLPLGHAPFARYDDTSANTEAVARKRSTDEDEEADKRQRTDSTSVVAAGRSWSSNAGSEANGSFVSNSYRSTNDTSSGDGMAQSSGPYYMPMNDQSFRQPGLSAQLLREDLARNQAAATRAMLLAQLASNGNNGQYGGNQPQGPSSLAFPAHYPQFGGNSASMRGQNFDMVGANQRLQQPMQWGNQFQGNGMPQQVPHMAHLQPYDQLSQFHQANSGMTQRSSDFAALTGIQDSSQGARSQDFSSLLRNLITSNNMPPTVRGGPADIGPLSNPTVASMNNVEPMRSSLAQRHSPQNGVLELPLCEEGQIDSHYGRPFFPLGIEEDPNWLSEFHCYVRSDLVEVFRASQDDVRARNNSIAYQQVGLRCRFCAHITPSARAGRSSAFPSSLRQIYQSFTMMLRDHFANCDAIPADTLEKFTLLKDKPAQGATDSKRYWIYSATKIGMQDTSDGLMVTDQSRAEGTQLAPFGTVPSQTWEDDAFKNVPLVLPSDRSLTAEFLFVLMSQVQPIRLTEAECIGNRRSLRVGLPGFGCKYCCDKKRLGLCRMFPARRRTLPSKMNDLYDHLRRCTLCPNGVKELIETTKLHMNNGFHADQGGDREFFDRIWTRLGHAS